MKLYEVKNLRFSRHVKDRLYERYRGTITDVNKKLYQLLLEAVEYPQFKYLPERYYLESKYKNEFKLLKFYKSCGIVFIIKENCVVTCFYRN
jgi:hypothetical protein